jgi:PAS domain S-box-containing protein
VWPVDDSDIRRAFRFAPGRFLICRPDDDFTIVGASAAYLQATHTDASIFGRPLFDVFPDNPAIDSDGTRNLRASLLRVIAARAPDTMAPQRYDVRKPDGEFEERHWLPINSPVLSEDGEVEFIIHRVDDAKVAASKDAVRILEDISEGFFTLDRQWRFDYVNAEAYRILGRTPAELRGQVLWDVYPGLEGTAFEQHYFNAMYERIKSSFTGYYEGIGRWFEVNAAPAAEGVSVFFRDVSAQKAAEQERERLVLESERQRRIYETALDSTPDFVYVFDLEHRALYANAALMKVWGVDDVRGKQWMDLGYEQWHADLHDREIDQVIDTRAPIRGEIPFTGTNGRRIYDYIFAPVLDATGEVVAVAGTTRDITERQAAEQAIRDQAARLTEADRAKDEFLATLAHELRNPLAPLRNSIELLKRPAPGAEPERLNDVMERQVNQLVRLVDDLLELSRINSAKVSLRIGRVALSTVVRDAIDATRPVLDAAGHTLSVVLPGDPVFLEGDETRLAQILVNLLNNAAKYTGDGGRIDLRAQREDGFAVIRLRDNGVGIAPSSLPSIFEMFNRGERAGNRSQAGLGIGLALSRQLAELHGGTLEASSPGLGLGSEFTLRIPLAEVQQAEVAAPTPSDMDLRVQRVLVCDDNADAGDTLAALLRLLGAEVRIARDGIEALAVLEEYAPTVAILDIGMPGMNGYEVARTIRTRMPDVGIKLVALTGWAQDADRKRALDAGFDHHMVKPPNIGALQALLAD